MSAAPGARGDRVRVTVTWLAMDHAPAERPGPAPPGAAILDAPDAPLHYFLYLYRTVGGPWHWTDWLEKPEGEQRAFACDPEVSLHTLVLEGWPAGFFMLDRRAPGVCDLAYFGLVPEAVGRGLGRWFLRAAVAEGWARPGTRRLTVNTCTLDHPRALGLYRSVGFEPLRQSTEIRSVARGA